MAQTYFNLDSNYIVNPYRFKPIQDGFLLTNDFGGWVYLDKDEFALLRHNKLSKNPALFSLLKDKGFAIAENSLDRTLNDFKLRFRAFFRGIYNHVIFLDDTNNEITPGNIKKIADFILQTPSREIIIEFKQKTYGKFEIIKNFANEFNKNNMKNIIFKIEADLNNFNNEILEFLINNKFEVWVPLKSINITDAAFSHLKELQRRHKVNFYIDVSQETLAEGQKIVDFFAENNFTSFFIRKTGEISREKFIDFWKKIIDKAYEVNKKSGRIVIQESYTSILLRKINNVQDAFYPELNSLCTGAIISQLAYSLKGGIYANEESFGIELFKLGDVNSSYTDIVSSEDSLALLSASLNGNAALEASVYKPYINSCPVCNYLESSNIIGRHPSERTVILNEMLDYLFEKILFDEEFLRFVYGVSFKI
ncbi:hypothetical protein HYW20_06715 [Candidatus Woesearchaeota archaeon]|nr:hypothetical protein [Candidatus Woesearchaeota archaeon]